jgi:hypothetical protein
MFGQIIHKEKLGHALSLNAVVTQIAANYNYKSTWPVLSLAYYVGHASLINYRNQRMKKKGFNEILILMKLQIQFAKVTIAGVFDLPVLVLFSSVTRVTSCSGNPAFQTQGD